MKKALINLLKVKSLLSITGMIVFIILSLNGRLDDALIATILTMIFQSFFTKDVKDTKEETTETVTNTVEK